MPRDWQKTYELIWNLYSTKKSDLIVPPLALAKCHELDDEVVSRLISHIENMAWNLKDRELKQWKLQWQKKGTLFI